MKKPMLTIAVVAGLMLTNGIALAAPDFALIAFARRCQLAHDKEKSMQQASSISGDTHGNTAKSTESNHRQ